MSKLAVEFLSARSVSKPQDDDQGQTPALEAGVVGGGGDFAEGLAGDFLSGVGVGRKSDVVDIGGEGKFAAGFGNDVASQTFSIEHHFCVEAVAGVVGAGFCGERTCGGSCLLGFVEGGV